MRYAIDAATALRVIKDEPGLGKRKNLVGPAVLRSHAMAMLYREVDAGHLDEKAAKAHLEGLASLKIRLLGDRVSRSVAWKLARQLGWDDPTPAEYLAVASLQADVLVASDEQMAAAAEGIIPLASYDDLLG